MTLSKLAQLANVSVSVVSKAFSQQFVGLLLPQAVSGVGRMHRLTPSQWFVQAYARCGQDMQKLV